MIAHPNGDIYVTDGYRNARVHRFTRDGKLVTSWGTPGHAAGQFHLPHSIAIDDDGKLYVADRANQRIQIFSPDGDFLGQWTGMGGPNDITPRPGRHITSSPSRKTTASRPMSACAMRTEPCSSAWRAAMSMAWASTRAATSTPD